MFDKVYTNPACKSEEGKAMEMIQRLYHHFTQNPEALPMQFKEIAFRDGIDIAACDFIAGMTDRYAIRLFEEIYIPKSYKGVPMRSRHIADIRNPSHALV
jgi:dGTPase